MIAFSCGGCSKKLQVKDAFAGKSAKCPHCGHKMVIPAPAPISVTVQSRDAGAMPPPKPRPPLPAPEETVGDVAAGSCPVGDTYSPHPAGVDSDKEHYDFLAPSKEPGELGRLGSYRVLKVLGVGGMGVVFQAEDPSLERIVALKAMKPALAASGSAKKRFVREAKTTAKVKHDHIVAIYQVGEDRGVPFLAMEFLEGEPLDERIKREGKLPVPEVLRIGREMAEGLAAAHEHNLIHRDIKPGNVWLEGKRGRVKILDFGLARAGDDDTHLTQTGTIVGTPAYMAPEQAQAKPVDARSDLFSLGCVLYRLSTGELPFQGKDALSMVLALATQEPRPPHELNQDLPPELSRMIMRLLEKNAAARPASARAVVEALQAIETDQTLLMTPPPAAPPPAVLPPASHSRKPPSRRRGRHVAVAVAASIVFFVVVALALAAVITLQTKDGTVTVTVTEPDVKVFIDGQEKLVIDSKKVGKIEVSAGKHSLIVKRGDEELYTESFTLKSGGECVVEAKWTPHKAAKEPDKVAKTPGKVVDDAWLKSVAVMKPEEQVAAVAKKLKELNPGFDGKVEHKIENGVVTELKFLSDNVTDISPVRGLVGLQSLDCSSSVPGKSKLSELSPLKGMSMWALHCAGTAVSDLSPLKEMKLRNLGIQYTPVSDLSPLKNVGLYWLHLESTKVSDLSPLQGMPLSILYIAQTRVSDLSPLKDMKLQSLAIFFTEVTDLSPLKDMPLKTLWCDFKPERDTQILLSIKTLEKINDKPAAEFWKQVDAKRVEFDAWLKSVAVKKPEGQVAAVVKKLQELNPGFDGKEEHKIEGSVVTELKFLSDNVTDISPVRGLVGLQSLECEGSEAGKGKVSDLSPLKGMKLKRFWCQWTQVSDLSPLKDMPLELFRCNGTLVTDLSPLKGMNLWFVECGGTKISDLSPLRNMPLGHLQIANTKVTDLSPLKEMKLGFLMICGTEVADLTPLKGMPLSVFWGNEARVTDLSPLRGILLTELYCDFRPERDAELVRSIKTLEKINFRPTAEFWKGVDANRAEFDAWLKSVAAMKPEEQVGAVVKKLQELNPGFDGKETHTIENGAVTKFKFNADNMTEISPVRALVGLRALDCAGISTPGNDKCKLFDLSPIKDLNLVALNFSGTQVADLTPLKNMKLTELSCCATQVTDFAPLKNMKLTELYFYWTPVSDLSPLKGMPLTYLSFNHAWGVKDLSALRGMPLESLDFAGTPVTDLSPLRGMSLKGLACEFKPERDTEVLLSIKTLEQINGKPAAEFLKEADGKRAEFEAWLKSVAAMKPEDQVAAVVKKLQERNPGFDGKETHTIENAAVTKFKFNPDNMTDILPLRALVGLRELECGGTGWPRDKCKLWDLSPIKDLNLEVLDCSGTVVADLSPLKNMKLIELNCEGTLVSDLSPLKNMKLTALRCPWTPVSDLSPLKDMKLTELYCGGTPVSDLSPLKDMKLTHLDISYTKATDLASLRGMPLSDFYCVQTRVKDLSPLKGSPLKRVSCDFTPERDAEVLRSIKTLETINDKPAAEVLKETEKK
jgi:serine/threonine protein kinase/Leucine-rich repeat (LRR) protein/DNA-directed RNA polymerase subunit RPC12/RpoP